jgi:subtilisin
MMKVTVTQLLNNRINSPELKPGNISRVLNPGDELEVEEVVTGQPILGNDQWLKLKNGSYAWTGGTNHNGDKINGGYPWWINTDIQEFWKRSRGKGVKVAVLDTGVTKNHPALASQIKKSVFAAYEINTPPANMGSGDDFGEGHGTRCIGMIAAHDPENTENCCGVAPECEIYSYRITGADGDDPDYLVNGIISAIKDNVHVISISRNIVLTDNVKKQIQNAIDHKVIVCVCGGNKPNEQNELVQLDGIIKVGVISQSGDDILNGTSLNSAGNIALSCYAPGINVKSTGISLRFDDKLDGSSFSTPYMAGIFALKLSITDINSRSYYEAVSEEFNHFISTNSKQFKTLDIQKFLK